MLAKLEHSIDFKRFATGREEPVDALTYMTSSRKTVERKIFFSFCFLLLKYANEKDVERATELRSATWIKKKKKP